MHGGVLKNSETIRISIVDIQKPCLPASDFMCLLFSINTFDTWLEFSNRLVRIQLDETEQW